MFSLNIFLYFFISMGHNMTCFIHESVNAKNHYFFSSFYKLSDYLVILQPEPGSGWSWSGYTQSHSVLFHLQDIFHSCYILSTEITYYVPLMSGTVVDKGNKDIYKTDKISFCEAHSSRKK